MGRWLLPGCMLAVLSLSGGSAWAKLCEQCAKLMYTMDIGRCVECRGATGSGAFKLCDQCSDRLSQCEHCRGSLAQARPPSKPAPPTSQPAETTITPAARELARRLEDNVKGLVFRFAYHGPQDKPFYTLTLSVPDFMLDEPKTFDRTERITAEQAGRIIELLLADGWFDSAADSDIRAKTEMPSQTGYYLRITGYQKDRVLFGPLGWDLKMLGRLDGIRKVLDREAAKAMDLLIGRLGGLRRQWQEVGTPASAPASPG